MKSMPAIVWALLLCLCGVCAAGSLPERLLDGLGCDGQGLRILVAGSAKKLFLVREGAALGEFRCAFGRNGLGKAREGDGRTPLGDYRIKWMVSRHGPAKSNPGGVSSRVVDGKTYSVLDTELYFGELEAVRVHVLPDGTRRVSKSPDDRPITAEEIRIAQEEKLWTASYGGKDCYVMALDYPGEADRRAGKTGSSIEIHASAHLLRLGFAKYPGTSGCIALLPADAEKVYRRVVPGTPVRIAR